MEIVLSAKEFGLFRDFIYNLTGIILSDNKIHLVKARLSKRGGAAGRSGRARFAALAGALRALLPRRNSPDLHGSAGAARDLVITSYSIHYTKLYDTGF